MKKIIVAIDGHSSCGKSTMAKALAKEIGYIYIDTGAMYRAVTLFALRRGFFHGDEIDASALEAAMGEVHINFQLDAATGLPLVCLNGEDSRHGGKQPCESHRCAAVCAYCHDASAAGNGA